LILLIETADVSGAYAPYQGEGALIRDRASPVYAMSEGHILIPPVSDSSQHRMTCLKRGPAEQRCADGSSPNTNETSLYPHNINIFKGFRVDIPSPLC
jgi:hypothetical protein